MSNKKMIYCRECVWVILAMLACPMTATNAQDEPLSAREEVWWEAAELLSRREYSLAANLLENELTDPGLHQEKIGIQSDLSAVKRVLALSGAVQVQSRKLRPGTEIVLMGMRHRFKGIQDDNPGTSLVLEDMSGKETRRALKSIDATAWLKIAEPAIQDWEQQDLVLAVFLTFDRFQDAKRARQHLNVAAEKEDVAIWLSRLEEAEGRRHERRRLPKKETTNGERFVGRWRVTLPKGPGFNLDVRKGGRASIIVKNRRLNANWTEESGETIRLTGQSGRTFLIHVSQDRIFGQTGKGIKLRGVRMADR